MPCPHYDLKIVGGGHKHGSAVSSSAYQSGEKLYSEREQVTRYYPKRSERIIHTEIMLPDNAPPEYMSRERLWNSAEMNEPQRNAQYARRFVMALPRELSYEDNLELVRQYCQEQFVSKGMCVDLAYHYDDSDNPHVHILVSRSEFRKEELTGIDDSLIRISKGYIQSHRAMRDASRIATEIAGPVNTINRSIIERTKALDTRICSIDLLLMDIGKTMDDGYIEITDKALKRQNKVTRKEMVSRLKELCHMKMGFGMKVEEKNTKYERYWKLSPFFWTKLRILNGDDSIPVEKEEMKDVSFEELPKEFEAKEQIIIQDDREEDKVFIRLVDNYNRIHLFHASDGSKSKGLKER